MLMHQEDMCYNEVGLCALNLLNYYRRNNEHNWEDICDCVKKLILYIMDSYNFCISISILKFEIIVALNI